VKSIAPAYELTPQHGIPLMYTVHCLRYSLGWCASFHNRLMPYREPLYLVHGHTRLRLQFDCKACRMMVYDE
ncbi:MAG: hypothetical protein LBF85_04705, partial [Tannerella sp.]|jgi:putative protease|nr:hypothetical protein [Tannerella sp.]